MYTQIYNAIVLDTTSKESLKRIIEVFEKDIPKNVNFYCHHLTLKYGKNEMIPQEFLGRKVELKLKYIYRDENCCTVTCEILDNEVSKYCNNVNPHITIYTVPPTKPIYSNNLIVNSTGFFDISEYNYSVYGIVKIFTKEFGWI